MHGSPRSMSRAWLIRAGGSPGQLTMPFLSGTETSIEGDAVLPSVDVRSFRAFLFLDVSLGNHHLWPVPWQSPLSLLHGKNQSATPHPRIMRNGLVRTARVISETMTHRC